MEIVFTIHCLAGKQPDRKMRRTGVAAQRFIETAEAVIDEPLEDWVDRRIPLLGVTVHHIAQED